MQHATERAKTPPSSAVTDVARPLTILHVAAPALVGGLESVLLALAGGQQSAGHRVHVAAVVTPGHQTHPLFEPLRHRGVEVHPIVINARSYLRERASIDTLCQMIRPDIVHTHGYRSDVVDSGVARRRRIPVVSTVHGFTYGRGRGRLYEWLQRRALRRFDAVVAVSQPQVGQLVRAGVPAHRIHLIRNAWCPSRAPESKANARIRLGAREDSFHIGWVGRLSPEKGADVLIDALPHLAGLNMQVSIVGSGHERPALEARAAQLGVAGSVLWHDLLPLAEPLFPGFDVFVLSSRTEGTPITLFEAMAAGTPIVATAVGGVPDVVTGAESVLVPSEDPEALAQAIRAVHANPGAAAVRAVAARARVAHDFAVEPWLQKYEQLYRALRKQIHSTQDL